VILTICRRGHNRSGAVKCVLDDRRPLNTPAIGEPLDVVQLGVDTTSFGFLVKMMALADKIIVIADEPVMQKVPKGFEDKLIFLNIGDDIWGRSNHPDLFNLVDRVLQENNL